MNQSFSEMAEGINGSGSISAFLGSPSNWYFLSNGYYLCCERRESSVRYLMVQGARHCVRPEFDGATPSSRQKYWIKRAEQSIP
jgi:hypothetical protein